MQLGTTMKQHAARYNSEDSLFVSIKLQVRSVAVTVAFYTKILHQEELNVLYEDSPSRGAERFIRRYSIKRS